MDYFSDVLSTFLCLDRGSILAVYGRVRELSDFIKISQLVIRRYTKVEMGGGGGSVIKDRVFIFG